MQYIILVIIKYISQLLQYYNMCKSKFGSSFFSPIGIFNIYPILKIIVLYIYS